MLKNVTQGKKKEQMYITNIKQTSIFPGSISLIDYFWNKKE